jgi:histidinol-phosphate aminotransferase
MRKGEVKRQIHLEHSSLKYPLSSEFLKELSEELPFMNEYPSGGYYRALSTKLAEYVGVTPDCILPTNGSDEVIESVTRAFGSQLILIPVPTFSQYEVSAKRNGFNHKLITCLQDYHYQLSYSESDLKKASLIWICNPNNPTGNSISRDEIKKILTITSGSGIVAVDECNYEYLGESVVDLVQEYPNLVISRSFSKNFGLAGFRLGYAVSSTRNIAEIAHYCQHFRVNKMAEIAGIKVLKYLAYFQKIWEEIAKVRGQFIDGLQQIGIMVFPSQSNFVLVDFVSQEKTRKVWQYLKKEGVYTFPAWGEEFSGLDHHYIRFTISNQQEMDYVLTLLERFQKVN